MSRFILGRALYHALVLGFVGSWVWVFRGSLQPTDLEMLPLCLAGAVGWVLAMLWCALLLKVGCSPHPGRAVLLQDLKDTQGRLVRGGTQGLAVQDPETNELWFLADSSQKITGLDEKSIARL